MIFRGRNEITYINRGKIAVEAVHRGLVTVWEAIRSCFGSGSWVNPKPWINGEGWKNR